MRRRPGPSDLIACALDRGCSQPEQDRWPASPPPKPAKLGDFLCFAVYSANLAFGRAYRPILDKLGLTYTQYVTLVALGEEDDQTVGDLGDKLFLESNTLTPILKKLEQLGLVERRRDPADERQVRVNLTAAGRKLRQQVESDAAGLIRSDRTRRRLRQGPAGRSPGCATICSAQPNPDPRHALRQPALPENRSASRCFLKAAATKSINARVLAGSKLRPE